MTPNERNVQITTCFGHFLSHFNMLVFPAVMLPLATRLNLPLAEVLGISFWMYLLFGITALPWGLAADRFGAKPLMAVYYAGAGLCGLAAAGWIDTPGYLALALAGIGLFTGIYHPAGLGLISKQITRISYGMGINGMLIVRMGSGEKQSVEIAHRDSQWARQAQLNRSAGHYSSAARLLIKNRGL